MRIRLDHTPEQAKALEKLLEKLGARTIMTGETQTEATFRDRPGLDKLVVDTLTGAKPKVFEAIQRFPS